MLRLTLALAVAACGSSAPPAPAPTSSAPPHVVAPPPAPKPAALSGIWLGTLQAGSKGLRIQIHLDLAASPATCSFDSLDQGVTGIPCTNVIATATDISFDIPAVHGSLKGMVSSDANTIHATWSQAGEIPVMLTRQATALEAVKLAFDPEMPAVDVDKIQAVLDADLAKVIPVVLPPDSGVGVTIGVLEHGVRKVFSYGAVKPDSVFEIGSISKTFTGLALAQMVEQKKVRFDEPVRELLPKGTVAAPSSGAEITLLDLSAQRSGLPRMPDNFKSADHANPYADYDAKALYAFISSHGVAMPATPVFGYSNLGVGLLGQLLAARAGTTYEALVRKEITEPLGMHDTAVKLTPALTKRFVAGHAAGNKPQHAWDFDALAGAGAIRSTAGDMLTYLDAQLHPDHVKGRTPEAKTLTAALAASHEVRAESLPGMHIALNWFHVDATGSYWHDGGTGGFSSFAVFDPAKDYAVIVLFNRSIDDGMFADDLAKHIAERLLGRPTMSLGKS
jgi:CubicO group peptidase (beta-lactamase class C family)